MSDFTSNFWALWVAGITIASIAFCVFVLWASARMKVHTAADGTTGHSWDEGTLAEINNPLPGYELTNALVGIPSLSLVMPAM